MLTMKLTRYSTIGIILIGLGIALFSLNFYTWLQSRNNLLPIYQRSNLGKQKLEPNSLYDSVETFVLFVGYARSGHSLIAAILDSHPEIVIANEFHLLAHFNSFYQDPNEESYSRRLRIFSALHSLSHNQSIYGNRSPNNTRGYSYHISGSWQGKYRNQIKVIGDKKGSGTAAILAYAEGRQHLQELQKTVVAPVKLIHVIRNPFDNIVTICIKSGLVQEIIPRNKVRNEKAIDFCIQKYFSHALTVQRLHEMSKYPILDVYSRDLIAKPRETLHKLCDFLGVPCYDEFVNSTVKILYSKPSKTRYSVHWTEEQKKRVTIEIRKFKFLKSYFSFDSA